MPPRKRKTRDEGGDDSPAAVKAKLRAQLDQRVDERIERNAVAEKRRRLDPTKWSKSEVATYLENRVGLPKKSASAIAVPGSQLKAVVHGNFTLGGSDAFEQLLTSIPMKKSEAVKEAIAELVDPLMPKFLHYDADDSGSIDVAEFKHLVDSHSGRATTQEDFNATLKAADLDGSGDISFSEFKAFAQADHTVASSLRFTPLHLLKEAEATLLKTLTPQIQTRSKPSLGVGGNLPPSKRLALTWGGRCCGSCLAMIILWVFFLAAFMPVMLISDLAVPNSIDIDALKEEMQGTIQELEKELQNPGPNIPISIQSCVGFVKEHCENELRDKTWSKQDFRSCARKVHPDKPAGSQELMGMLSDCNDKLTEAQFWGLKSASRDAQFWVFCFACLAFSGGLVTTTAFYSNTMAMIVTVIDIMTTSELISDPVSAKFPDLMESTMIYKVTCGVFLLVTSLALATGSKRTITQWVSGARVCDMRTGQPCGVGRVYLTELAHVFVNIAFVMMLWLGVKNVAGEAATVLDGKSLELQFFLLLNPVIFIKPACVVGLTPSIAADGRSWGDALAGTVPLLQSGPQLEKKQTWVGRVATISYQMIAALWLLGVTGAVLAGFMGRRTF